MITLKPTSANMITTFQGRVTEAKPIAGMTDSELREVLSGRRATAGLKATVQRELDRRQALREITKDKNDYDFRQEVIDALMAEGRSWAVAAELTNTPLKLDQQARRLGL